MVAIEDRSVKLDLYKHIKSLHEITTAPITVGEGV